MGPSYYTEDASEMQQEILAQSRVNEGLENRLDQIKHSIKNQRADTLSFGLRGAPATGPGNSISNLEEQLRFQRARLDDLQASQSSNVGGRPAAPSSSNLERAYDDLAREIEQIKAKLQQSITNESAADSPQRPAKTLLNTNDRELLASSQHANLKQSIGGYTSLRGPKGMSAKSMGRRSGAADGASPGNTVGRSGTAGVLEDPDYSLSVSELNSNIGNSLLQSNSRRVDDRHYA